MERCPAALVAQLVCPVAWIDKPQAQQRCQDAVGFGDIVRTGQELLDLVDQPIDVSDEDEVIFAGERHELRPRDVIGEVSTLLDPNQRIVDPMQHEGRSPDGRQGGSYVDLEVHAGQRHGSRGTCRVLRVSAEPVPESGLYAARAAKSAKASVVSPQCASTSPRKNCSSSSEAPAG